MLTAELDIYKESGVIDSLLKSAAFADDTTDKEAAIPGAKYVSNLLGDAKKTIRGTGTRFKQRRAARVLQRVSKKYNKYTKKVNDEYNKVTRGEGVVPEGEAMRTKKRLKKKIRKMDKKNDKKLMVAGGVGATGATAGTYEYLKSKEKDTGMDKQANVLGGMARGVSKFFGGSGLSRASIKAQTARQVNPMARKTTADSYRAARRTRDTQNQTLRTKRMGELKSPASRTPAENITLKNNYDTSATGIQNRYLKKTNRSPNRISKADVANQGQTTVAKTTTSKTAPGFKLPALTAGNAGKYGVGGLAATQVYDGVAGGSNRRRVINNY